MPLVVGVPPPPVPPPPVPVPPPPVPVPVPPPPVPVFVVLLAALPLLPLLPPQPEIKPNAKTIRRTAGSAIGKAIGKASECRLPETEITFFICIFANIDSNLRAILQERATGKNYKGEHTGKSIQERAARKRITGKNYGENGGCADGSRSRYTRIVDCLLSAN